MRKTAFLTALLAGTLSGSLNGQPAPSGSGAAAPSQGLPPGQPSQGLPPSQPSVPPLNRGQLPPGLQNRQQLPPGLQNRDQLPPGLQNRIGDDQFRQGFVATNNMAVGTNLFGSATNQVNRFGTNFSAFGTNQFNATNAIAGTNQGGAPLQDQALTPGDQRLLAQVRQAIRPMGTAGNVQPPVYFILDRGVVTVLGQVTDVQQKQQLVNLVRRVPGIIRVVDNLRIEPTMIGLAEPAPSAPSAVRATITQDQAATVADRNLVIQLRQGIRPIIGSAEPWSPVHFISRQGTVTLVGFVPNEEQRGQLVTIAQQTPGVVRVIDQLQVNAQVNTAVGAGGVSGSGTTTDLLPTGRTNNNRVFPDQQGLPPGLQRRELLPPGLQNREQLPPGLDGRLPQTETNR